jgi:osmotically-inducible protein OsmY
MTGDVPAEYVAEHLRAAFARDARVQELGLDVIVRGETVVVQGAVATPDQRDAVAAVAHEMLPGATVVNDVDVPPNVEPGAVEDLGAGS